MSTVDLSSGAQFGTWAIWQGAHHKPARSPLEAQAHDSPVMFVWPMTGDITQVRLPDNHSTPHTVSPSQRNDNRTCTLPDVKGKEIEKHITALLF